MVAPILGAIWTGTKWVLAKQGAKQVAKQIAKKTAKKRKYKSKKKETRGRPTGSGPQQKQRLKDVKKAKKGTYTRPLDAHGNPKKVRDMTKKELTERIENQQARASHGKPGMGRHNGFTKGDTARYKAAKKGKVRKNKPLKF